MEKKTLTKEEWARVEKALSGVFGFATMRVDGYEVTFHRVRVGKNRLAIVTYVNGEFKGSWGLPDKEFPEQKFLRPASRFIYKPSQRAKLKKLPKRILKEWGDCWQPDEKFHYFDPTWPSTNAIRRHYEKTFNSIELIKAIG